MKNNSNMLPFLVEFGSLDKIKMAYINIDIKEAEGYYEYEQAKLPYASFNYSGIVDALVQHKYPIDKMQAVINNYLLDPNDAYAIDEFNKMQAWRKEAKEIAKQALEYELH